MNIRTHGFRTDISQTGIRLVYLLVYEVQAYAVDASEVSERRVRTCFTYADHGRTVIVEYDARHERVDPRSVLDD